MRAKFPAVRSIEQFIVQNDAIDHCSIIRMMAFLKVNLYRMTEAMQAIMNTEFDLKPAGMEFSFMNFSCNAISSINTYTRTKRN